MAKKKIKYLRQLEDTLKHHARIGSLVSRATKAAVKKSLTKDVPVTFLRGHQIIKRNADGSESVVSTYANNRRNV